MSVIDYAFNQRTFIIKPYIMLDNIFSKPNNILTITPITM